MSSGCPEPCQCAPQQPVPTMWEGEAPSEHVHAESRNLVIFRNFAVYEAGVRGRSGEVSLPQALREVVGLSPGERMVLTPLTEGSFLRGDVVSAGDVRGKFIREDGEYIELAVRDCLTLRVPRGGILASSSPPWTQTFHFLREPLPPPSQAWSGSSRECSECPRERSLVRGVLSGAGWEPLYCLSIGKDTLSIRNYATITLPHPIVVDSLSLDTRSSFLPARGARPEALSMARAPGGGQGAMPPPGATEAGPSRRFSFSLRGRVSSRQSLLLSSVSYPQYSTEEEVLQRFLELGEERPLVRKAVLAKLGERDLLGLAEGKVLIEGERGVEGLSFLEILGDSFLIPLSVDESIVPEVLVERSVRSLESPEGKFRVQDVEVLLRTRSSAQEETQLVVSLRHAGAVRSAHPQLSKRLRGRALWALSVPRGEGTFTGKLQVAI